MFVTCGDLCLKLAHGVWQEDADTRILLHAKHAVDNYPALICITKDTDVFIIFLALNGDINSKIFIRRGTQLSIRLVDITKLAATLGRDVCTALLRLHSRTGCDTVGVLAGQGKLRALENLLRHEKFREAFASLGNNCDLPIEIFSVIQDFTCQLDCCNTKTNEVNELRYKNVLQQEWGNRIRTASPCEGTLRQHTRRANYQAVIWRRSLINSSGSRVKPPLMQVRSIVSDI